MIYSADDNSHTLYVHQYIPSELTGRLGDTDIRIVQSLAMSGREVQSLFEEHAVSEKSRWKMCFMVTEGNDFALSLRIPVWVSGQPVITVNDKEIPFCSLKVDKGYVVMEGMKAGNEIGLFLPGAVKAERLPDAEELAAFVDGPVVLAGLTRDVDTIKGDLDRPDEFLSKNTEHVYDSFIWLQNNYVTRHQPKNIRLIPLYEVTDEPYTIYFEELNY